MQGFGLIDLPNSSYHTELLTPIHSTATKHPLPLVHFPESIWQNNLDLTFRIPSHTVAVFKNSQYLFKLTFWGILICFRFSSDKKIPYCPNKKQTTQYSKWYI